jgi:hypothetical protein
MVAVHRKASAYHIELELVGHIELRAAVAGVENGWKAHIMGDITKSIKTAICCRVKLYPVFR